MDIASWVQFEEQQLMVPLRENEALNAKVQTDILLILIIFVPLLMLRQ